MKYARLVDEPWNARLTLTAAPATEPVSVDEQQRHSRIDQADAYLPGIITAARQWVEQYTGRQLITATWTLVLDRFPPDDEIEVPRAPLVSVTSVKYYDADRALQTFAAAGYHVHVYVGPEAQMGRIELAEGTAWPTTYSGVGAVQIEFVAGYGAAAAVPIQVKQAIMLMAGELYERRELATVGTIITPNIVTAERLLWPLRLF